MTEITHCPHCGKKLSATLGPSGRTELTCMRCDTVDAIKTEVANWVQNPLANPPKAA